jgi:hypothetical protein
MDERERLTCMDPELMLRFLPGKPSERKLRLFGLACCRRVWHLLPSERWERLVEVGERFVDQAASRDEFNSVWWRVSTAPPSPGGYLGELILRELIEVANGIGVADFNPRRALAVAEAAANAVAKVADERTDAEANACPPRDAERAAQSGLLGDLFGNAFRPVALDTAWRSSAVLGLAQAAYDDPTLPAGTLDPERLAILADALEEAGCDQAELLGHLRSNGPHVRGCWAVDLLLGRS